MIILAEMAFVIHAGLPDWASLYFKGNASGITTTGCLIGLDGVDAGLLKGELNVGLSVGAQLFDGLLKAEQKFVECNILTWQLSSFTPEDNFNGFQVEINPEFIDLLKSFYNPSNAPLPEHRVINKALPN